MNEDFIIENGILEGYRGKGGAVAIPDGVKAIGACAFENCLSITALEIPAGVEQIASSAFHGAKNLRTISVAEGNPNYRSEADCLLTKDGKLVRGGNAGNGAIPKGVTEIEDYAFSGCDEIEQICFSEGIAKIGAYAFEGCASLKAVSLPEGVTRLELGTFSKCRSLASVLLPKGLTSVASFAFEGCASLTEIRIPDSVTAIGDYAFDSCVSLAGITAGAKNPKYRSEQNCLLTKDGKTLILGCKGSVIPNGVEEIAENAFRGCTALEELTIPNSVRFIGENAFLGCKSLVVSCTRRQAEGWEQDWDVVDGAGTRCKTVYRE